MVLEITLNRTIQEPDKHKDERKQLISEGHQPWSRYVKDGKQEELWVKGHFNSQSE